MTFEQLYEAYFTDVYRFALWLTRDRSEAEDVASETFVRAWARRGRLRTNTLKAYLLATARNIFLNQRGRARGHAELSEELPDGAPDPHRQTNARIELERVNGAIGRLPETDGVALVLRSEHSLPYSEIARVLEISKGAARVKVHRARRRLLAELMTHQGGT
ncbi:MAG: RNA polymerase sigma factor [Acidobacteria bacterium]|nr:RNA polymerase sigma factor [Candidatus Sulfomarinibacter sp. MAG AM1]